MQRRIFLAGLSGAAAVVARAASATPVRYGIIGTGQRGRAHIRFIDALGGGAGRVVAVADSDPARLPSPTAGVSAYGDYRRLLDDQTVDAVVVATPNFLHKEHAVAALAAGKHVLCEKPLATSVADCEAVLAAAAKSGRVFLTGHELRLAPVYQHMTQLLADGLIGGVKQILHEELRPDWFAGGWRYHGINWRLLNETTGGALVEKSCHFTDLFRMVTGGNPVRVSCSGGVQFYKDGRETWDHAALVLEYSNGVTATHNLSMFHRPESNLLRVLGEKGVLRVRDHSQFETYAYGQAPQPVAVSGGAQQRPGVMHSGDVEMHAAFVAAIVEKKPLPFDNRIAADAVKTCLLGQLAAQQHATLGWDAL